MITHNLHQPPTARTPDGACRWGAKPARGKREAAFRQRRDHSILRASSRAAQGTCILRRIRPRTGACSDAEKRGVKVRMRFFYRTEADRRTGARSGRVAPVWRVVYGGADALARGEAIPRGKTRCQSTYEVFVTNGSRSAAWRAFGSSRARLARCARWSGRPRAGTGLPHRKSAVSKYV